MLDSYVTIFYIKRNFKYSASTKKKNISKLYQNTLTYSKLITFKIYEILMQE